jgi:DNA-binding FadR family transcriptional regulator
MALLDSGLARLEALAVLPDAGDAYAETTYRLLILCARQCDNQRLQRMLTALSLQTLRYSKLGLASIERRQQSARLWRQAAQALRVGDAEAHGGADAPADRGVRRGGHHPARPPATRGRSA